MLQSNNSSSFYFTASYSCMCYYPSITYYIIYERAAPAGQRGTYIVHQNEQYAQMSGHFFSSVRRSWIHQIILASIITTNLEKVMLARTSGARFINHVYMHNKHQNAFTPHNLYLLKTKWGKNVPTSHILYTRNARGFHKVAVGLTDEVNMEKKV